MIQNFTVDKENLHVVMQASYYCEYPAIVFKKP